MIVLYLLFSPLVHLLRAGLINANIYALVPLFKAVAGVVLLIWIWPRYLRDLWRPASIAGDALTDLQDEMRRESRLHNRAPEENDVLPLSQRSAPTRW